MRTISYEKYLDKVTGCFIGKAISGNIGAPHEGVKMPLALPFMQEMINPDLPNDDLDLQVLWLDVMEEKGAHFTSLDLLERFCRCTPYSPGEYSVMRKNFQRGIYPPYSGKFCNDFYIEGMGCPIRSEVWGCVAVGNPALARELSSRDGVLDHAGESVEAEMFLAALECEAFFESDIRVLIDNALKTVPADSKFRRLVEDTVRWCDEFGDSKTVLARILFHYGHPDCTNMYENMGITLLSLLLGEQDIIKTSLMALNCGFDTDCTCATAGAIIGLLRGARELTEAYGLADPTYTLGVESHRRSNKIRDLAEDIAAMGVRFSGSCNPAVCIEDAPEVAPIPYTAPDFEAAADYVGMPALALGESTQVLLTLKNNTGAAAALFCHLAAENGLICDKESFSCGLEAGESCVMTVTVTLPADTEIVYDTNLLTLTVESEAGENLLIHRFGIAGAAPWKLTGPFWRTEPICTTEDVLKYFAEKHPYKPLMMGSAIPGNRQDKTRHFHLNFATDTTTEYLPRAKWGAPLTEKAEVDYCEALVSTHQDSFRLEDFFGFRGPCVTYLSRVVVSPDDREICLQIGHTAPFTLYLNGEELASRDFCDTWTAENVHLEKVRLRKGDNLLVFRLTRVNDDAKFNIHFCVGMVCDAHITDLATRNPYFYKED